MEPTMKMECSYLYGVVASDEAKDFGPVGLDGGDGPHGL